MQNIDDYLAEQLDPSTLQAKLASVREAAPKDPKLESEVQAALRAEVERIGSFCAANPSDQFAKVNQHLLQEVGAGRGGAASLTSAAATADIETWKGIGSVNLTSFAWWAVGGTINFAPPYGLLFGGKGGPDWAASTFTSATLGSFVVDPAIIVKQMRQEETGIGTVYKGRCKFQLGQLGAGAGAVRISFYALDGTYWGLFGGISGGLGGASISGELDLVWSA